MRPIHRLFLVAAALAAFLPIARAGELSQQTFPQKWIDEYLPEKLPELKFPAYFEDLDKARALAFAGRYKTALILLPRITKGDAVEIAQIKATCLAAVGRRTEAISILSAPGIADIPKAQVLRAKTLAEMGRHRDAIAILKSVIEKDANSLAARFHLAQVSEQAGDLNTARDQYDWIQKTYYAQWEGQGAKNFEDAELVTLMGRAFDRWAVLNSKYAGNPGLPKLMLKVFVQAYDIIDRTYWPAHVAAAEYFMSHGNTPEAGKEIRAALAGNPNDVRCHVLLGLIALEQWNFDATDKQIAAIRGVDPDSIDADLLETRSLLQQRLPNDAEVVARRVLSQQPDNLEAMGLLAGACALQLKEDQVKQILADVEKIDPNNASAYVELADVLSSMRQYPRSETMYRKAIDRAPWLSEARNGLGLLLTQSGDEDGAKIALEAAYAMDPFNYRTANYLILLGKMDKMQRVETPHFIIMFDKTNDPMIPEYLPQYMESIHAAVCGAFKHEPAVKTYIEVFPSHDEFSARITGSPWIGTVGASTGRVIAICAPRRGEGPMMSPYNWAQVLRHEYTHTVTLSATENRIPHWLTEGLAVSEEHVPLRWEWVPMLYNAVKQKRLFTMDDLTWAFVRPKRPQDRQQAYAQSFWICEYIRQKWNEDAILKMMELSRQGKSETVLFQQVLGMTPSQFSTDFFAWAEKQVASWGYDAESTRKYNELMKKADTLQKSEKLAEAIEAWTQVIKVRPMDALARQRLAGLYLARETYDPGKALDQLIPLHQLSLKNNGFAKRIARLYIEMNDFKLAEKYALESINIDPYDLPAHELLLAIYEKTGNKEGIDREKRVLPELREWTKRYRKSMGAEEEDPK